MWDVDAGASTPLAAWIPPLEATERRLRRGARVAEVGFAATSAVIDLAIAYPASTFHGFDDDDEAVATMRLAVARAGVSDRVTYEVRNRHADLGRYDVVRARATSSSWRRSLRHAGVWIAPERGGVAIRIRSGLVPAW
jgi:hypothetical protein